MFLQRAFTVGCCAFPCSYLVNGPTTFPSSAANPAPAVALEIATLALPVLLAGLAEPIAQLLETALVARSGTSRILKHASLQGNTMVKGNFRC